MGFFKKKQSACVPDECAGFEVKTESSVCTGEKTIGFYNPKEKKLMYTELVKTDEDIENFYKKYGLEMKKSENID
ncbi:MAG: hypothetical protein LUE12_08030 [Ruminococcus sp.]|nr:hypothetical protein [Ruminococcus sp.]